MSENQIVTEELQITRSYLLPSLAISYSVAFLPLILTGLLLIDIGETFGQPVGLVGQLNTVSSLVGAIVAALMGVWSVRFTHKSLLLVGLMFFCVSAVGCSFSLNFTMLLITFSLTGFGFAMVIPMVFAIIGANLPLEKRTSAIGWISAISAFSYIFGAPIIGFIAKFGGWKWAYIGFVLPITFLGLMMAAQWIPSQSKSRVNHSASEGKYLEGFKMVFSNKSAIFCLVSYAFLVAGSQVQYFSSSFFRE